VPPLVVGFDYESRDPFLWLPDLCMRATTSPLGFHYLSKGSCGCILLVVPFIPVLYIFSVENLAVSIVEGIDVSSVEDLLPLCDVLLCQPMEYLLLLSSTVSAVDNIFLQPCLWSIPWQTVL
jgi:hypothetical protein